MRRWFLFVSVVFSVAICLSAQAQAPPPAAQGPLTITLADAFARARKYGLQVQAADILARLAHEDRSQAVANTLPNANGLNQFVYTQNNGTPSGVFVANDGIHVYTEQVNVHEEVLAFVRRGEIRYAAAAEAVARARVDIAVRGLNATVIQNFYAIAGAQRKAASLTRALSEARHFFEITQKQEAGGEVAHSDVIKAQISVLQRSRDVQDAELAIIKAKVALGILIFPQLQTEYEIADDLATLPVLPPLSEITAQALDANPSLRAAQLNLRQFKLGVTVARYQYLPSFGLDVFYGINANQFLARTDYATPGTGQSTKNNELVPSRQNLGYAAQATLNLPLWTWGAIHSRVKQASLRAEQAGYDLTLAQRNLQAQLASGYREAATALSQVQSLRTSADLSSESLRLTLLRYQAGEAVALEVTDAQTTAAFARAAYVDGLYRYRVALSVLQTLTGNF